MTRPGLLDIAVVDTFAEADEILKSRHFMQDQLLEPSKAPSLPGNLNSLHGTPHFQRRRLESRLFRRLSLKRYEEDILLPELRAALARVAAQPRLAGAPARAADLQRLVRSALVRASATLIGLDLDGDAAVERLLGYSTVIAEGRDVVWATQDQDEVVARVHAIWRRFLDDLYLPSRRRRERLLSEGTETPPPDLITVLLQHPDAVAGESADLLAHEVGLFLTASVNTTTAATPRTVEMLCRWVERHPEDRPRLADLGFLRQAAHEALRLRPTVPFLLRQVEAGTVLSTGRAFAKDELVRIDIAAANRDPRVFGEDAEEFDPHRLTAIPRPYGLSFGGGIHICIGLELTTGGQADGEDESVGMVVHILRELFAAGLELDPDDPPRVEAGTTQRKYVSFPVLFTRL